MDQWWRDFQAFRILITPRVIPVVFWIAVAIAVIMGITIIAEGGRLGSPSLIFFGIVTLFFGPLLVRILCELVITFFRGKE